MAQPADEMDGLRYNEPETQMARGSPAGERSTEDVFREPILSECMFNKEEAKYLKSQLLARVATATAKGKPNVAPVGFEFDGKYFYIGSIQQKVSPVHPEVHQHQEG